MKAQWADADADAESQEYIHIHAFLSKIAESVYSMDAADQLITLDQLRVIFTANAVN